jgi:indole-3-glycerol phosphate synthase
MTDVSAPDLLATIVAAARRNVEVRSAAVSEDRLASAIARRPEGSRFMEALRDGPAPRIIAECKRRSPSRGILRADYHPGDHARAYAEAGAAAISVLTEPTFFDGSLDHLRAVRAAVATPLLRKDFIVTRYQLIEAAAAGADAALIIVAALRDRDIQTLVAQASALGLAALVEVHDERELARAVDAGAVIVGVNSRNLRTLEVDPSLHERLAARMPARVIAVAESGLRDRAALAQLEAAGYHAFLVGERLITHADPGAALRELRRAAR